MRDSRRAAGIGRAGFFPIGLTLLYVGVFIILPFGGILAGALRPGVTVFFENITRPETLEALTLSLSVTAASLVVSVIFGIAAAWLIAKFRFPGREVILSLINLPLSISPVIVGLLFVVLLGKNSPVGGWLESMGVRIIFAWPGLFLVTLFISFPYIVRELLPVLSELGNEDEEAAITLGASGAAMFLRVTLPNIRLALLYGITLSGARAIGEYGAVSVVSGLLRGRTVTLPVQVQIFYAEYMSGAAFASAVLFFVFGIITLASKFTLETKMKNLEQREDIQDVRGARAARSSQDPQKARSSQGEIEA